MLWKNILTDKLLREEPIQTIRHLHAHAQALVEKGCKKKDKKRKSKALDIKINVNKENYFTKRINKS